MYLINFYFAWIWILFGFVAGAVQGMFFHKDNWQGGYSSWSRRLTRLGHISFFGLAIINFLYVFSLQHLQMTNSQGYESYLFIIGGIAMPIICYGSAYQKKFRHLFFIPVLSLISAVVLLLIKIW